MEKARTAQVALSLSLAGAVIVGVFMSQIRTMAATEPSIMVWALFVTLSLLGASATMFPHVCSPSKVLPYNIDAARFTHLMGLRIVHGHHAQCGHFQGHEYRFRGKTYCAGCTGLLLGALSAVIVVTAHFILGYVGSVPTGYVGLLFVLLGLLYIPLQVSKNPVSRAVINFLFVVGFSFTLVTVDLAGNLGFDLFLIGLSLFWVYTRIQLSNWSHDRICQDCEDDCPFREPRLNQG